MSISKNLKAVNDKIKQFFIERRKLDSNYEFPILIAVSKLKPVEAILEAYEAGQRDFGENYIKELVEKANHPKIIENCQDIKWHFIGHLQSNKAKKLNLVKNLSSIQTIDSLKLAEAINKDLKKDEKLDFLIQINTSNEENKYGINPTELIGFLKSIKEFNKLNFKGLMTIGSLTNSLKTDENEDFNCLLQCKENIKENFEKVFEKIELSMGMSNDFDQAILKGTTYVRIGSSIFGSRN